MLFYLLALLPKTLPCKWVKKKDSNNLIKLMNQMKMFHSYWDLQPKMGSNLIEEIPEIIKNKEKPLFYLNLGI